VIEGTLIDLMCLRIVPSIRQQRWSGSRSFFTYHQWSHGGLEAHQGFRVM